GSGIIGLNCALRLRERFPNARILVLERGMLPQGASTKNAGFTCFGSISEIISDLRTHSEEEVFQLVQKRWEGVQLLRRNLGDLKIDYQNHGGHEVFLSEHRELYQHCLEGMVRANKLLKPIFKSDCFKLHPNTFNFERVGENYISSAFEGQINTGMMMGTLLRKVRNARINILNSITVETFRETGNHVVLKTDRFELKTQKLF